MASRHLSYIFRHTNLLHRDGSLSLHELLYHQGTARKVRSLYRDGMKSLQLYDEDEISMRLRDRGNTFRFLMPLAHVICDSNKARAMIGFVSTEDFQPGITPVPDNWFMTADFGDDAAREAQADILEGVDIASIFIRFESGHSTDVAIRHCPFMPDRYVFSEIPYPWNKREKSFVYSKTRSASWWYSWWPESRSFCTRFNTQYDERCPTHRIRLHSDSPTWCRSWP